MSNIFEYKHEYDNLLFYHTRSIKPQMVTMHNHDICELLFIKSGNVTYNVGGKCYPLTHNCLVRTRPFEHHSLSFGDSQEYDRYVILFDEKMIYPDIYAQIPSGMDVMNFTNNGLVIGLLQKLDYYFTKLNSKEFEAILLHVILELLYNIRFNANKDLPNNMYIANKSVTDALQYIDANIHTQLNIDEICDSIHITKSYLHQLFVKYLQTTPKQYILSQKLTIAQRELRLGAKPTEVYLSCGFMDYSTFYRAYTKHFGHMPSDEINTPLERKIYY